MGNHSCTGSGGFSTSEIWGGRGITKAHVQSLRLVRKNETAGAGKLHMFGGQAMGRWKWRGD